jgi:hypothetical protein
MVIRLKPRRSVRGFSRRRAPPRASHASCAAAGRVCRTEARVEILATLGQRAEAASLFEDRMYRMLFNWCADLGLLGERLRGEPAFEAYVKPRG